MKKIVVSFLFIVIFSTLIASGFYFYSLFGKSSKMPGPMFLWDHANEYCVHRGWHLPTTGQLRFIVGDENEWYWIYKTDYAHNPREGTSSSEARNALVVCVE